MDLNLDERLNMDIEENIRVVTNAFDVGNPSLQEREAWNEIKCVLRDVIGDNNKVMEIEELVIKKIRQRRELGLAKYGVTVEERTDLSTLDWLQHAQDEAMDLSIYLEKLIKRMKGGE